MSIPRAVIPNSILDLFKSEGTPKKLRSKEHLVREGELSERCYLLDQGVLRYYFCTDDGSEVTRVFLKQQDIPLAYRFFSGDLKTVGSFYAIQSLGDSYLKSVPWSSVVNLVEKNQEAALFFLKKNEEIYFYRERSLRGNVKSALENYKLFLEDYLDILPNVSDKVIASYLNISAESLSRIKKK